MGVCRARPTDLPAQRFFPGTDAQAQHQSGPESAHATVPAASIDAIAPAGGDRAPSFSWHLDGGHSNDHFHARYHTRPLHQYGDAERLFNLPGLAIVDGPSRLDRRGKLRSRRLPGNRQKGKAFHQAGA